MRYYTKASYLLAPFLVCALLPAPRVAHAQQEQLTLGALQRSAERQDPRAVQSDLNERGSSLRQTTLRAERLPSLSFNASGQYQSHVARIPFALPGGGSAPTPHRDIYDTHVAARQAILDPSHSARRQVERGQLAESEARLRTSLYGVREDVNEAFFSALRLRSQGEELTAAIASLESHLAAARSRVEQGVSLPSEVASLEAELLSRRQSVDELASAEQSALHVLASLTGAPVSSAASLQLPQLSGQVLAVRDSADAHRNRPEYAHFESSRELLASRQRAVSARDLPSVSAFARAGYGRPGLNPLAQEFDSYWLAGVQVEWAPWTWGTTGRQREELSVQQEMVQTEEAAFTERIGRAAATELATIERLLRSLESDDEIVTRREDIHREARSRYREGVITSAEFLDRENDALSARIARAVHRVELEHACARYLTLVGVEVD